MNIEDTLVVIKPDTLLRGLVGTAIDKFEKVGLKMVACKMMRADREIVDKLYNTDNTQWVALLGEKTLATFKEYGVDTKEVLGTDDKMELGLEIVNHLKEYMQAGPVIAMVWEGVRAVSTVRKMRGSTTPLTADIGSLLGDFSHDSQFSAPFKKRALQTMLHASGNLLEAREEIPLFFGKDFKPMEYERVDELYF